MPGRSAGGWFAPVVLLLLPGACRVDRQGIADIDATADPEAGAETAAVDGGAPGDDAGACVMKEPPSRWATWPMPVVGMTDYDVGTPGVVVDRVTHLTWERDVAADSFTWAEAGARCACLDLAGHDDWRLPTRIELVSLIDVTRQSPAIDRTAFPDTPSEWFWTSSPAADDPVSAWYVAFFDGDTHHMDQATAYHVRCVRSEPSPTGAPMPAEPTVVRDDGTVLDVATGLTWQRAPDPTPRTWSEAAAACAGLPVDSQPGDARPWRLPDVKELQTLIDESRADPAIDPVAFPDTPSESFWASTPLAGQPGFAWFVSFHNGVAYNSQVEAPHRVRC
ncbi:MAG TPA: DUF1566 domain-containing protein, partial [Polyangia bacterium]|nr:DUF1566 domain-containing protein [Polyangia bacterium]